MSSLLTWSDRGIGKPARHHGPRPSHDLGPIRRMLSTENYRRRYEDIYLLCSEKGQAAAELLQAEIDAMGLRTHIISLPLKDPSNHQELFNALKPLVQRLSGTKVDVLLSAGTPQMQTLWVVLIKAGLLRGRMLQVIPASFVPDIHPEPVREVTLDFAGFPEITALTEEVLHLRAQNRSHPRLTAESPAMKTLLHRLHRVAKSSLPVLIRGETGSGKELIAKAVHDSSLRRLGPIVCENCGALSETILESELFGHVAGAFTGAQTARRGLFEMAHQGTLFLDEIGELSPKMQVSLLRVLQEGTIRPVGSEETIQVDVRIVAATHRDLGRMVTEGDFRQDLYYRLRGAELIVPPLRQRKEDLKALIGTFLDFFDSSLQLTNSALQKLYNYPWPGNVRELRAEVTRWQVFCDREVDSEDLSQEITKSVFPKVALTEFGPLLPLAEIVQAAESEAILRTLEETGHNLSQTAKILAIDRNTLKRKLAKYHISRRN